MSPELESIVTGLVMGIAEAANQGDMQTLRKFVDALVAVDRDSAAMYAQALEIALLPETAP